MSVLTWGEPKVEISKLVSGSPVTWTELEEIQQNSAQLTTEEGDTTDALDEGGDIVDSRRGKNRYTFTFALFRKRGDTKPIVDEDGVITDEYAIRLTPEDATLTGWKMLRCKVSVAESWTSADGSLWTYTFRGLKPTSGNTLTDYTAPSGSGSGGGA